MAVVKASNSLVELVDIYGNKLLEVEIPSPILQIRGSPSQKDPFFAVLTTDRQLLVYEIELQRLKNATDAEVSEAIYSNQYKKMFHNYQYKVKPIVTKRSENRSEPIEYSLHRTVALNQTYDDFAVFFYKSEIKFVLWSKQDVTLLSRSGKELLNTVSIELETFRVSQTSLIYTRQNTIGFLKSNGRPSAVSCRGEH